MNGSDPAAPPTSGHPVRKLAVGIIGSTVLALGVALIFLPGPAMVVIPIGLGILATEFAWARGILPRIAARVRRPFDRHARGDRPQGMGNALPVVIAMVSVVASFSISLGFSHFRQRHIEDELANILHDEGPGLERLAAIRSELVNMGALVNTYLERTGSGHSPSRHEIDASRSRLDAEIAAYRALPSFPGEPELVSEIEQRIVLVNQGTVAALDEADRAWPAIVVGGRDALQPRLDDAHAAVEHLSMLNSGYVRSRAETILEARRAGLMIENVLGGISGLSAVVATLLVLRSLRARRRLDEAHARLLAERAAELEAFAGRVAHDLKNPLAAVALRVTLARREKPPPRVESHLERVAHQVGRMNKVIDGLLEFAVAGARPESNTRASLTEVCADVVADLSPAAQAVGVELSTDQLPAVELACTEGALTSVLSNLVGNAVKYVVEGPRLPHRITIRAKARGSSTRVEVEDNGPGLPPDAGQIVFEPFRRLADRQPGIGLGLATVKKIVEAHGGRVGVDSKLGEGSSFWFELPNVDSNAAVSAPAPASPAQPGAVSGTAA